VSGQACYFEHCWVVAARSTSTINALVFAVASRPCCNGDGDALLSQHNDRGPPNGSYFRPLAGAALRDCMPGGR